MEITGNILATFHQSTNNLSKLDKLSAPEPHKTNQICLVSPDSPPSLSSTKWFPYVNIALLIIDSGCKSICHYMGITPILQQPVAKLEEGQANCVGAGDTIQKKYRRGFNGKSIRHM